MIFNRKSKRVFLFFACLSKNFAVRSPATMAADIARAGLECRFDRGIVLTVSTAAPSQAASAPTSSSSSSSTGQEVRPEVKANKDSEAETAEVETLLKDAIKELKRKLLKTELPKIKDIEVLEKTLCEKHRNLQKAFDRCISLAVHLVYVKHGCGFVIRDSDRALHQANLRTVMIDTFRDRINIEEIEKIMNETFSQVPLVILDSNDFNQTIEKFNEEVKMGEDEKEKLGEPLFFKLQSILYSGFRGHNMGVLNHHLKKIAEVQTEEVRKLDIATQSLEVVITNMKAIIQNFPDTNILRLLLQIYNYWTERIFCTDSTGVWTVVEQLRVSVLSVPRFKCAASVAIPVPPPQGQLAKVEALRTMATFMIEVLQNITHVYLQVTGILNEYRNLWNSIDQRYYYDSRDLDLDERRRIKAARNEEYYEECRKLDSVYRRPLLDLGISWSVNPNPRYGYQAFYASAKWLVGGGEYAQTGDFIFHNPTPDRPTWDQIKCFEEGLAQFPKKYQRLLRVTTDPDGAITNAREKARRKAEKRKKEELFEIAWKNLKDRRWQLGAPEWLSCKFGFNEDYGKLRQEYGLPYYRD